MEFIRAELRDGPKPAADMFKKGRAEGYSTATMKRAKKEMGVVSDRDEFEAGTWQWSLPEESDFDDC